MKNQLPLSFQAPENATLDNFVTGDNKQLLYSLADEQENLVFLWGEAGSGKSHLLQAICTSCSNQGKNSLYLPLQATEDWTPELFDGLEAMDMVCLDNIDNIIGQRNWEEAFFHFFNRLREAGGRLIVAARSNAHNLGIDLPDLRTRLGWGVTYQVRPLCDDDKMTALRVRANERGFDMSNEVARYLMKYASRDMRELIELLNRLDYASLAEQRKLTIPFIKRFLVSV